MVSLAPRGVKPRKSIPILLVVDIKKNLSPQACLETNE